MRLPLRFPAPLEDAPVRRCAYLEALAGALVGVPLRAAADVLSIPRSRGRYGAALQWQLGLEPHDGRRELDWEDRIEIKLVTVWATERAVACDKLKVCDAELDPRAKLSNLLLVVADRLTRIVLGTERFTLAGAARERLAAVWDADPHFSKPAIFVEARRQDEELFPATYLAASWLAAEGIVGPHVQGALRPDGAWFTAARRRFGVDPRPVLVSREVALQGSGPCPACANSLRWNAEDIARRRWSPAIHAMPVPDACARCTAFVVDATDLPRCRLQTPELWRREAFGNLAASTGVFRLCDHVLEPDDHRH